MIPKSDCFSLHCKSQKYTLCPSSRFQFFTTTGYSTWIQKWIPTSIQWRFYFFPKFHSLPSFLPSYKQYFPEDQGTESFKKVPVFQFQKTQTTHLILLLLLLFWMSPDPGNLLETIFFLFHSFQHCKSIVFFLQRCSPSINNRSSERQMAKRHMKHAQHCNHQGNANQWDIT